MFASNERRTLGQGGFDPGRNILAITLNLRPHGYAYEYCTLWDSAILESGERPSGRARKPFGRISIANTDAGAHSYTNAAVDRAYRAVRGVLKT